MSEQPTFEEALSQLEQAVERLERGDLPLEQAFALFEEGVRHAGTCRQALQAVELQGERLTADAGGALTTEPLSPATEVDDDG